VPEPLWLCDDPAVIGRPFFLMRRRPGEAARFRIAKDLTLAPDRPALVRRLAEELARLHAIRPGVPALAFLPEPAPSPALALVDRYRRFLDDVGRPYPGLEWGLRWLALNAPAKPADGLVLCHNDFRSGNYLVDETGLTGILDWEIAGWGDPLADIGWFCARCWRSGRDELEAGGIGQRADLYAAYTAASGRPVDANAVAYWEVFAHVRYAVIAAQQTHRSGGDVSQSLEWALTGHAVPELELEILRMTEPD
jgi:aminoglycoside phosphotransferase (APT) family kinase protein